MNEKTAKLLQKMALAKGLKLKDLKQEWQRTGSKERFKKRQQFLQDVTALKK